MAVEFAADGGYAYRPGELLVPEEQVDRARTAIQQYFDGLPVGPPDLEGEGLRIGWRRFQEMPQLIEVALHLRSRGISAQPNHVLFATCGCGCGTHPSHPAANSFYANPFYANPFYANPFYANPFYANSFYANPFYANPNPGRLEPLDVERRESSARPADPVSWEHGSGPIRVTVLDTGLSHPDFRPSGAGDPLADGVSGDDVDVPDAADPDDPANTPDDGYLDPAAGHGTFIAGVIKQITNACTITVDRVLTGFGAGDEVEIADTLRAIAGRDEKPHFLNLSFGGYSPFGMLVLAAPIADLIDSGVVVVASAGNDGVCAPLYPAAFPDVVSVAALDGEDNPARFSNYGTWVRACTLGDDVVSSFFAEFNGNETEKDPETNKDIDDFDGWAVWSGTSFAAPRVVAALAQWMAENGTSDPYDAVAAVIDDPEHTRMPMMGTMVLPTDVEKHWETVPVAHRRIDDNGN